MAELQIKAGAKHALCFNHVPANSTLEQMCAGYMEAFKAAGDTPKLTTVAFSDSFNPIDGDTGDQGTIAGRSEDRCDLDARCGAGDRAVDAIDQLGKAGKVANASLGLSVNALQACATASSSSSPICNPISTVIMGWSPPINMSNTECYRPGRLLTGPLMITKDNVDQVLKISKQYPGVRGAS